MLVYVYETPRCIQLIGKQPGHAVDPAANHSGLMVVDVNDLHNDLDDRT